MTARSVSRPILYGTLAGAVLGSLLVYVGWPSPDSAACYLLAVSILACGVGGGLVLACGPKALLAMTAKGIRGAFTVDDLMARILPGTLIGLVAGPIAVVVSGFVIGGLFGVFVAAFYGLYAVAAGAVVGAIAGTVFSRWRASLGVIALVTTAVMFLPLWLIRINLQYSNGRTDLAPSAGCLPCRSAFCR